MIYWENFPKPHNYKIHDFKKIIRKFYELKKKEKIKKRKIVILIILSKTLLSIYLADFSIFCSIVPRYDI